MKWISTRELQDVRAAVALMGGDLEKRAAFLDVLLANIDGDWLALTRTFEAGWAVRQRLTQPAKESFSQTINFEFQMREADKVMKEMGDAMSQKLVEVMKKVQRGG